MHLPCVLVLLAVLLSGTVVQEQTATTTTLTVSPANSSSSPLPPKISLDGRKNPLLTP